MSFRQDTEKGPTIANDFDTGPTTLFVPVPELWHFFIKRRRPRTFGSPKFIPYTLGPFNSQPGFIPSRFTDDWPRAVGEIGSTRMQQILGLAMAGSDAVGGTSH
jgi:hypothetical protein